jgi:hypothetical protein
MTRSRLFLDEEDTDALTKSRRPLAMEGARPSVSRRTAAQALTVLVLLAGGAMPAAAAALNGVSLPDSVTAAGQPLMLNGIGLRTYSVLGIRIYVAGLYLQQRSNDPAAILRSPGVKLLDFRFLRDVDASDARHSWQQGLQDNCRPPCSLPAQEVAQFLAAVPSVHRGDSSTLLFAPGRLDITVNGRAYGTVTDPLFAQVVLSNFIGPVPSSPSLKRALLGGGG